MKHWGLFLFALAFTACRNDGLSDKPGETYYITPEEGTIETDYTGIRKRIPVASNCDWHPGTVPEWCIVEKTTSEGKEYLDLEIRPNPGETPRETTIPLLYGRNIATASLSVSQSGKEHTDPLKWERFSINKLSNAEYELSDDQITRKYRITGTVAFVAPTFMKQVYPGHLINRKTDNYRLTAYDQYTYNPITVTITSLAIKSSEFSKPSFEATNELVQQAISNLSDRSVDFSADAPVQYNSYRHLHLLGMGNLGISLNQLITGRPYTDKEMARKTGIIYNYSHALFNVSMDYPEKLVEETIGKEELPDLVYINSVIYGKTSLLLVESDDDFTTVKVLISKIANNENLSDNEVKIKDKLDIWYIYFDTYGTHTIRGGSSLIGRCIEEMQSLKTGIIPLNFTVNNLEDNSVGEMEIDLELP